MEKMIVLLRGINVGGNRKVPMAALRDAARKAGLDDIETYIQSGNLLFTAKSAADAEARIEALIEAEFGFAVGAVARSATAWAGYAGGSPFPQAEAERANWLHLGLSKSPLKPGIANALHQRATLDEQVAVAGDAIWIDYRGGVADSKLLPAVIDRAAGSTVTMRNWRTVRKLAEMAGS